jgi:hypothetical protein
VQDLLKILISCYNFLILIALLSCLSGSYTHLLRMLVAEFTLTENPANTTTSQLRTVCHADDSVILGTWLQETDHRTIEDQVCNVFSCCCVCPITFPLFSDFFLLSSQNMNLHCTVICSIILLSSC